MGNLPTARPRTYVNGMPLIPEDINELFDAIIGGKHAEVEHPIAACGFIATGGTVGVGAEQLNLTDAASVCSALRVPVGDRVTTIRWGYGVGAAAVANWRLCRRIVDGSAAEEIIAPASGATSDSTPGGFESTTQTYNHQIAAGYVYTLQFFTAGTGNSNLFGASVKADRL